MLPPFHGERMRAYEAVIARGDRARRSPPGRAGERVRAPPEHAGDHARGDPARGLRRRGRRAPREALRDSLVEILGATQPRRAASASPIPAAAAAAASTAGIARLRRAHRRAARRGDRRAPRPTPTSPSARTSSRCCVAARFDDGSKMDDARAARPADDAAARRPRDDGDRARLGVRPAASTDRDALERLRAEVDGGRATTTSTR